MEEVKEYFSGDTSRFSATFRDLPADPEDPPESGPLLDPATVTVTVYDVDEAPIFTGTPLNDSTGVYIIDYTVPLEAGTYYMEWKGIVNSKPEIIRDKFKVSFYIS